ncbi:MAG: 30S ribosomal protein S6 [Candidatus Berkelbacteria bacterium]|nr:30S ribosomal protein S6 [Candidatus Berkelbacteria bacterium]
MREYELTYLVSDDVAEADLKKITDKVAGFIVAGGGKVSKEESWGRRKLAYPILKLNFATYITIWFEMEATKLAELDHELRVFPQVIRHLTTLKVERAEVLKVTKEDIVDAAAVEEVIGEKSFEVVEGETEASKNLMAVREIEEKSEIRNPNVETKEEKPETEEIKSKPEKKITKAKKIEKPVESKEDSTARTKDTQIDTDKSKAEDESERMKKLDEKLDELLGDDL